MITTARRGSGWTPAPCGAARVGAWDDGTRGRFFGPTSRRLRFHQPLIEGYSQADGRKIPSRSQRSDEPTNRASGATCGSKGRAGATAPQQWRCQQRCGHQPCRLARLAGSAGRLASRVDLAPLHLCTFAPLHLCTCAPLHLCTFAPLHQPAPVRHLLLRRPPSRRPPMPKLAGPTSVPALSSWSAQRADQRAARTGTRGKLRGR